ncbi:hypothetical protein FRX31_014574 [Thalictrum thalictroides]|uniref:Uncharacterized protein n=1 Tax=Thalictrum thalictroides TaxID=46969 RepID=A0A7J6WGS7_THATH|nr:hypothetical protein FRX31_014574 [Thalictrum thalictroides]
MDSISEVLFDSFQMNLNAFVNGSLNLIGKHGTYIVAFHLGSEDFEVIQTAELTVHDNTCGWKYYTLGVIEDCLSFLDAAVDNFVEIWLRKNENGIASWVKQFSIDKELLDPRF